MQPPFDIAADLDTPVSAFRKLEPFQPHFLLESVEGGVSLARYSFIGFGDALNLRLRNGELQINGAAQALEPGRAGVLDALRQALEQAPRPGPHIDGLPFHGGLVGVAAYDLVRYFERLPQRATPLPRVPDAAYTATSSLLVFDHLTRRVALLHDGSEAERKALRTEVIEALRGPLPPAVGPASVESAVASLSGEQFNSLVRKAQDYIGAGDVYQIVLSVCFSGQTDIDPFDAYRALRLLNPSPYMYFFRFGDAAVAGSSPEALVRLDESGRASLRPIAGTRPRGNDNEQDRQNEADLLADPKEGAEHVMLVDLARNDLGRVARPGTVKVSPYRNIERYSHVMHIVSGVSGQLDADCDAFDLFAAAFPAGTLVGAPKVRAMELIDENEPQRRGLYGGTVGYFAHGGSMDQAIAIRTLVFDQGNYSFQAGAGIVADSIPQKEYEEVLAKSAILQRALKIAGEGL
ncbi:MAG: anthranilate synthase component I family protein [Gammaproteobacteria bacterium]|nr:anthranilate synthase component I family protein [Gammaproteobacteria bacterium]NNF60167.1 anthranilate synthase component I family protein [Gammaproteobacteria bacterium]NNM21580.1 anthranilate synthase component I family protein [Gammaproteobacteria bacterium]